MDLGADMVRDQAHDPFAVSGRKPLTSIGKPLGKSVDPEPSVGVEHHLNDRGIFQKPGDGGAKGGAQHTRTPHDRFGFLVSCRHVVPVLSRARTTRGPGSG